MLKQTGNRRVFLRGYQGPAGNPFLPATQARLANNNQTWKALVVGDSVVEGFTPAAFDDAWINRLPALLRTATGRPASAMGPYKRAVYTGGIPAGAPAWTIAGTTNFGSGPGLADQFFFQDVNHANSLVLPVGCTSVDLLTSRNNACTTIYVDENGVQVAAINTIGADGSIRSGFMNNVAMASGATLRVRGDASTVALFNGAWVYSGNETRDIVMINGGLAGTTTGNWVQVQASNFIEDNGDQGNYTTVFICLGTNDWRTGVAQTTVQSNLNALIDQARAGNLEPVLVLYYEPASVGLEVYTWAQQRTMFQDTAAAKACALIDYGPTIGSFASPGNPFDSGDQLHPNAAGHLAIANLTRDYLLT